jgi:predicted GNAT family acetyltransferase
MNVEHDMQRSRFVIPLNDGEAELVYKFVGEDAIDLQHTAVPPVERNKGVADLLVRAAVAYAREHELRVIATCPYVQAWVRRHPEEPLTSIPPNAAG